MTISFTLFGLLFGTALPGRAQAVCDDPANRTQNCDFATDISFWALEFGSSFSHASDGNDGPGSIEVDSQLATDHLIKINQCIGGLSGIPRVNFGASYRVTTGSVEGCGTEIVFYTDDNCTSFNGSMGVYDEVFTSTWTRIGNSRNLNPSTRGIRINALCFSQVGPITVRIDDVFLGEGVGESIFADDFESGSTLAWSSVSP